jgi:molybdenum cofactor synthesis domain-containing protein
LSIGEDELHEDNAAAMIATALMGDGVEIQGEPKEGKINIVASRDGLLKVDKEALLNFNINGDVMCATLHTNTLVKKGRIVAGTRAIPLVVKRAVVEQAVAAVNQVLVVRELKKPRAGVVITGNEVYYGRIKDAFAQVIEKKIRDFDGEVVGIYYAPDDETMIEERLRELIDAGADLLITTGGMSVDPDDVTRFAIRNLGATDMTYGSAVLPGAMFLIAYLCRDDGPTRPSEIIPILGIPACGMYHKNTVFDLILPRVLSGEKIGRRELAELGHGGLCMNCPECRYPVCPFGK